jgi:hypothetical protein
MSDSIKVCPFCGLITKRISFTREDGTVLL